MKKVTTGMFSLAALVAISTIPVEMVRAEAGASLEAATALIDVEPGPNKNKYENVTADAAELPLKLAKVVDAIGRVTDTSNKPNMRDWMTKDFEDGIPRGSAFHIGNGLVLSAGHITWPKSCPSTVIEWGYRSGKEPYLKSQCVEILARGTIGLRNDFVVMVVEPAPPIKLAVDLDGKYQVGESLSLLGHPGGRPLQRIPACKIAKLGDGEWERMFQHNCAAVSGNSGGPLISLTSFKAVGILTNGSIAMKISALSELKEILARRTPRTK